MNAAESGRKIIRRSEMLCSSQSYCEQCQTAGELVLTSDFLGWRATKVRGFWELVIDYEYCTLPLEKIQSAYIYCSRYGWVKSIVFSLTKDTAFSNCSSYRIGWVYPWVRHLSKLGIPVTGSFPRHQFSWRGIVGEFGIEILMLLVGLACIASFLTRTMTGIVIAFSIAFVFWLLYWLTFFWVSHHRGDDTRP